VVTAPVPLTAEDGDATAAVLDAVTDRTRIAFLDHVTSATARRLPLVDLVPALQERGVPVFVDGAHAPGMLDVDLDRLGADWWSGSLHKWCCTPRGTGVLYAAPSRRAGLRPLVASWWEGRGFPGAFDMTGTDDVTGWLSAPRAIRFLQQLDLDRVRRHSVELAVHGQRVLAEAIGVPAADLPRDPGVSMQLVPLPAGVATDDDAAADLQEQIGERIAVETAITCWRGRGFIRVSGQVYNAPAEYDRYAADLPALL
jgi:isopenicillin-N epimerase